MQFFVTPKILNLQMLWLILQSQVRKFLNSASPQIANPKNCYDQSAKNNWVRISQNYMVRKSQIRPIASFAKGTQIFKKFKSANLRICGLRNLFADRPSLQLVHTDADRVKYGADEHKNILISKTFFFDLPRLIRR
jgi:hypothetical protein